MSSVQCWSFGAFRLDASTTCLWRDEQLLPLPPKPLAVLAYLVAHAGLVVTKDELLEAVWPETMVSEGVLKTCLAQIRRVLGETAQASQYIATVHRRGYRFIAPVTALVSPPMATVESALPSRSPAVLPSRLLFVEREQELAQLQQHWTRTLQGQRQVVFVTGEAGIGKTTLVDAFIEQLGLTEAVWCGHGQCIEHYGVGEAYLPLLEALGHLGRGPDGADLVDILRQQAPSWLVQLPALVSAEDYETLQRRNSGSTRERMPRELAEVIETLTARRPLVLVLEDLHWSDYATIEWLTLVARQRGPARLLVLGTYRPADAVMRGHPVHTVTQELKRQGAGSELVLGYLSANGVAAYLAHRLGEVAIPAALIRFLHQRTVGNPFFLVTVVEELIRQELLEPQGTGWILRGDLDAVALGVPQSVRQLIEQQAAQETLAKQATLEAASVVGVEFAAAAVAAAVEQTSEEVEACCDRLARQGQFVRQMDTVDWPDGTVTARYRFLHSLYPEVLYTRVPVSRRVRWHRQIGTRLEVGYEPQARECAAELAVHFVHGRDPERAARYLRYAGGQAGGRRAHQEALVHLTKGLELLATLPATLARAQQELDLQIALGPALMAARGWAAPEVEQTYGRARALCTQLGETSQLFPTLWGLWRFYQSRGVLPTARDLGEQLMRLAERTADPIPLLEAR